MRKRISLILNAAVAAAVLYAWATMTFHLDDSGRLSSSGFAALKYFTVLSNLLMGAAAIVYIVLTLRRGWPLPRWAVRLKLTATAAVGLTFTVVMTFLGPLYGYPAMFAGASLWMHLLVPLAAAADFCLADRSGAVTLRDTFFALLPAGLYGAGYIPNVLIHGVGEWPNTNDWYSFFAFGNAMAVVIFVVLLLVIWGIALLLRLPRRRA